MLTPDTQSGASLSQGASFKARFKMWLRLHRLEARRGIADIVANPLSNLMTILVIAIALALPTGLQLVLDNSRQLSESWDGISRISLYLKVDSLPLSHQRLVEELRADKRLAEVRYISKEEGLAEFKARSGFSAALKELDENPLPAVIVIRPKANHATPAASESLRAELERQPLVEVAKLDLEWLKKLYAMLNLASQVSAALGVALAIAVLLIVGNTIRLAVQNRREEIEIVKLVGATDAFIRRPFLYTGFWYGLFAGIACWLLLSVALWWLSEPIRELASLYNSQFELSGLSFKQTMQLIGLSCLLGLLGAWLSVGRHIRAIEPR